MAEGAATGAGRWAGHGAPGGVRPAGAAGPLWEGVTRGMQVLQGLPIYVDDQASLTLGEVRRCIPRMQKLGTKFVRVMKA